MAAAGGFQQGFNKVASCFERFVHYPLWWEQITSRKTASVDSVVERLAAGWLAASLAWLTPAFQGVPIDPFLRENYVIGQEIHPALYLT